MALPHKTWQLVLLGFAAVFVSLMVAFDWNWFRKPLENYVSQKTQRQFTISDLNVDLGWHPTVKMRDVYFGNAAWSQKGEAMARVGSLEFSVSLRDLWNGKVLVPRVALSQADLLFEKASDARKNWVLQVGKPGPASIS
jgi:uncharacterized protein involved in outer membrane biogenesis